VSFCNDISGYLAELVSHCTALWWWLWFEFSSEIGFGCKNYN